ncbi:MAG: transcriptional regulator NrdR [Gammaproteobacteria bacterium]
MHCPFCDAEETKVIDSRLVDAYKIRRRRECPQCQTRFTTYESVELIMPWVIKRNGQREAFSEMKLRAGIERALQKRRVSAEAIDDVIKNIIQRLRASGEREVRSLNLGEMVMEALRSLDEVAYVRFASVYRQFQDVDAFHEEITRMKQRAVDNKKESS